jgi:hypothetical protein
MNERKAYLNWPTYDDDLVNKAYIDYRLRNIKSSSGGGSGDTSELEEKVTALDKQVQNLNTTKLNKNIYDKFINEEYNPLSQAVDAKIESYYQDSDPSTTWNSNVERETHIGDIWYDTTTQKTYVYYKDESVTPVVYYWVWQNVPTELIVKIDNKATIHTYSPPRKYSSGDYWIIPNNCFNNYVENLEIKRPFIVGETIPIGDYTLTTIEVDESGNILDYMTNIPLGSNYDISDVISNSDVSLNIVSYAQFELPQNCYGGTICLATNSNTEYDPLDWIARNSYIPSDKIERDLITKEIAKDLINETETKLSSDIQKLDDSVNLQVSRLDTTINGYYFITTDTVFEDDKNYYKKEDGKYILLVKDTDYIVGNNIEGEFYNFNGGIQQELDKSLLELNNNTIKMNVISTNIDLETGDIKSIKNSTGTFDENGMHYEKTGAKTSSTINQSGLIVNDTVTNNELLFAGYDEDKNISEVRTENMTVRNYLICAAHARFEEYDGGWGLFIV